MTLNWKVLILGGFVSGSTLGVWRAAERAEVRELTTPEFYFTSSRDWLCIQQNWGTEGGMKDAIRAWARTVSVTTDPASASGVNATKNQIDRGVPLSSCEVAQSFLEAPPSK